MFAVNVGREKGIGLPFFRCPPARIIRGPAHAGGSLLPFMEERFDG